MDYGNGICGRCAGEKRMILLYSRNCACRKCKWNFGDAVKVEDKLYEVETVREFTCLVDRVSEGGECEAAVTARTRCGWVKLMECGELMYGWRFYLMQKGPVYKSNVEPEFCMAVKHCEHIKA